jgi:hypothetical protein
MARSDDPAAPPASVRERLSRLLAGRRGTDERDNTAESAERQAFLDATWADEIPIVPAPLGRPRPTPAPVPETVAPGTASSAAGPEVAPALATTRAPAAEKAPTDPLAMGPAPEMTAPTPKPPTPTPTPTLARPGPPEGSPALAPPAEGLERSAWAARPVTAAEQPTIPEPPALPPGAAIGPAGAGLATDEARSRTLPPGSTAPVELLQAPPSAGAAVDDFFHGLVRRVEGDR